ncbi:MAG: hypothetical protein BGO31_12180 [Bacteroidetes bacterium 43-16]|nr:MAG: hypothetical protein BGO31_12180 [Bacteroidetes bacterium 43-16]
MPSSVILKYHYNEVLEQLQITFVSGAVYLYKDLPLQVFEQFIQARSKGSFFNKYIKPKFPFKKCIK